MSQSYDPLPAANVPRPGPEPTRAPSSAGSSAGWLGCGFALSFLMNIVFGVLVVVLCIGIAMRGAGDSAFDSGGIGSLPEKYHSGDKSSTDKVAIVTVEGAIMEGLISSALKGIEQAGKDDKVKAVVLRVNSPGGSITASEDLYRKILELKTGDEAKKIAARPLVVSMGSLAASGGYYIAAPGEKIFAERTTITGSIGVYASFPNIAKLADTYGVKMNTIKAGAIKDTGGMFKEMTPQEQQSIQDMVNDAYDRFMEIVSAGRPALTRAKLLERFTVTPSFPDPKAKPDGPAAAPYERYRADGGIYTAPKAKELGLVDEIGDLDDAVAAAAKLASLSSYRAVQYQKIKTLTDILLNGSTAAPAHGKGIDADALRSLMTPKVMYLTPNYEGALIGR